jgi:hypothetical protein
MALTMRLARAPGLTDQHPGTRAQADHQRDEEKDTGNIPDTAANA